MKNLIAFLAFIMMSQGYAQVPAAQVQVVTAQPQAPIVAQAAPVQPKRTLIYDERTNQLVEVAPPQAQPQVAPAPSQAVASAPAATATSQPIYILNNQKLQGYQGAVQDAPTTVVQEAPAKISASETIRKERQGAEAATEDGIVQTLEKARLEDEVRRRDRFNSALTSTTSATTQSATATVITAPAAPVAASPAAAQAATATSIVNAQGAQGPVITTTTATNVEENDVVEIPQAKPQKASKRKKVILEDETTSDSRDIHSEVRAAIAEERTAPLNLTQYYVAGQVGAASYNDYANIRGKLSSGVSLGMVTPERFVFEGSFMYSQFQVDDIAGPQATYATLDMNQYNFSAAAKYQLLPGKLRPTVGAIASYTRRNYSFAGASSYYGSNQTILSTDAFDAGLQAGLDLALTNNFSIGADFRYLWNIASKNSDSNVRGGYYYPKYGNSYGYNNYGGFKVVEDLAYYIATMSAKFTF